MAKTDEHEWCHPEFHRCDGGGPGEYARYLEQPVKRYRTIVVDPPWAYDVASLPPSSKAAKGHRSRAAEENYPTMGIERIMALPLHEWAEADAHLYVWTTNAFMCEAHALVMAWGFTQKTILTWVKPNVGMGRYFRNTTEHALFAVRGRLAGLNTNTRTDFNAPRGRHSEKPQAFYDMVETMSPGPYLDVFARKQRLGWDVYGNEVYSSIPLVDDRRQGAKALVEDA